MFRAGCNAPVRTERPRGKQSHLSVKNKRLQHHDLDAIAEEPLVILELGQQFGPLQKLISCTS